MLKKPESLGRSRIFVPHRIRFDSRQGLLGGLPDTGDLILSEALLRFDHGSDLYIRIRIFQGQEIPGKFLVP